MTPPSQSPPRWLWISAELPERLSTGRMVYSANLAGAVADAGVDLTMVGLGAAPPDHPGITWNAVAAELQGGWKSLLSKLPNLSYACAVPKLQAAVIKLLDESFDVVVIDHLQTAWAMPVVLDAHGGQTVFVTHNHEASVRRRVAREAPLRNGRRIVLTLDAWKAARLETATARDAHIVSSITAADRSRFEIDAPDSRHIVLAPGWSGDHSISTPAMAQRSRRVGILGSFDWHVKQENLRRFLPGADPILHAAGIELVVGGRVPDSFRTEMERDLLATRFVGWVDSTSDFLADCRIGLIAEPLGGGFKMKSLDYVFHEVAVATVSGSIEGIPLVSGESLVEADTPQALATAIVDIIDHPDTLERLAASALEACATEFTWRRRAETLLGELVNSC